MKINGTNPGTTPAARLRAVQERERSAGLESRRTVSPSDRDDRVEISAAGRARSDEAHGTADHPQPVAADDPARFARIRDRLLAGHYVSDSVTAAVARAIVERGDHSA